MRDDAGKLIWDDKDIEALEEYYEKPFDEITQAEIESWEDSIQERMLEI